MKRNVYAKAALSLVAGLVVLALASQSLSGRAEAAGGSSAAGFAIAASDAATSAWVVGPSGNVWICRADRSCTYVGGVY